MDLNNSGTWDTLPNGDKIWRLCIKSSGAYSINLIYDNFWLPDDAQFYVYNQDKSIVLGAFTSDNNKKHGKFSTDLIKGEATVLEYYEPAYASGGIINVDKVIHAYKNTFSGHGESGSCNIDVNCSQGDDWCVEKRTVSMILLSDNTRICSGCLVNNVRGDLVPYYITAFHCADSDGNGTLSQTEINDAETWIFRFKYWNPNCNTGDDASSWVSISGANHRVDNFSTDVLLMELSTPPPSGFGVLYAGWDRTSSPPQSGVGIHHPSTDVMKISLFGNEPINAFINDAGVSSWRLQFDQGVVEPGSSGSPLFNQNHKIVGQLYGTTLDNFLTCDNPTGDAVYGRFDISWNNGLSGFLDPDNTGVTSVNATSPTIYLLNKTLTGTHKFAALEEIHIEGNVTTGGIFCPPNNVPFTTEPGSNVSMRTGGVSYTNIDNTKPVIEEIEQKVVPVSDDVSIYPNPSTGKFEVEFSEDNLSSSKIFIYDIAGKLIHRQENINQSKNTIDICGYPKGMYTIYIVQNQNTYTKKVIVY